MDLTIHNVKEVSVTSRQLSEGLGMSTCIKISSKPSWSDVVTTEEISLFSDHKIITQLNDKLVQHERNKQ